MQYQTGTPTNQKLPGTATLNSQSNFAWVGTAGLNSRPTPAFHTCIDPEKFCSGIMNGRDTFEHGHGRRCEAMAVRRKNALVLEIIQGKTTVAEASRHYDLTPSEVEEWVEQGKAGMENALRAKPEDIREQYERQLKDLQEAYGEAMLELRARKKLQSLLGKDEP